MRVAVFETPLGRMFVAWTPRGLARVALPGDARPEGEAADPPHVIRAFAKDVIRFLRGKRVSFRRYRIDLHGRSQFSWLVYRVARRVAWGRTLTYGELARRIGRPRAARAVGACLGYNPVPLVVP
ncbi:MAG: methylated-DNA--[protein]-cysteine S-methyltransferase [Myxococcota bacterium]